MRITTKFVASSALLIVVTATLSASSYLINHRAGKDLEENFSQSQATVFSVVQLESALQEQIVALSRLSVLSASDDSVSSQITAEQRQMEANLVSQSRQQVFRALLDLEALIPPDDQLSALRLQGVRRQHDYLEGVADELLAAEPSVAQAQATARALRTLEQHNDAYIQALLESAEKRTANYRQQLRRFRVQAAWLEALSFGAVMLLLAAQFVYLLRPVIRSLRRLQAGADRIGYSVDGPGRELGMAAIPKIELSTQDELQGLAESFNQMSDRLVASYQQLERRVEERTAFLNQSNISLLAEVRDRTRAEANLRQAMVKLKQTQLQLLQTEKMSSLGQLVAGVAHEINNPVSFIQGNLEPAQEYMNSLLALLRAYRAACPEASRDLQDVLDSADVDFIESDFPRLLQSMATGTQRITNIVQSLQTFSHLDKAETKATDLHQGLDSAVLLMSSRLSATADRPAITVVRRYGDLPKVYCYPGQLNQVFMGLLNNAVDAFAPASNSDGITSEPTITLTTEAVEQAVRIYIADNGSGMSEAVRHQIFDPFFTTKPVGSGMGLGLSMSYQIVVGNHRGMLSCQSAVGEGTTFTLEIPLSLKLQNELVVPMPGLTAN